MGWPKPRGGDCRCAATRRSHLDVTIAQVAQRGGVLWGHRADSTLLACLVSSPIWGMTRFFPRVRLNGSRTGRPAREVTSFPAWIHGNRRRRVAAIAGSASSAPQPTPTASQPLHRLPLSPGRTVRWGRPDATVTQCPRSSAARFRVGWTPAVAARSKACGVARMRVTSYKEGSLAYLRSGPLATEQAFQSIEQAVQS